MNKLSFLIYKFLKVLDKFFYLFFKKNLLTHLTDHISKESYTQKLINNKNANFYTPNFMTKWRIESFYEKEPETLEWIDNFDNKKKIIFWDIGANIGLYSIYASLKHENIEVISFEPSTNNLRILSRNISINNLEDKIKINQFPLSDKTNQYAQMNESEFIEGWSMGTFAYKNDFEGKIFTPKQKYKIFGTSINYLLESKILDIPNYIKIDVDGIEHMILKGGDKYLDNSNIKGMLVELNENFKEQFDYVINIMNIKKFKLKYKKRSEAFYKEEKFSKIFNYVFERL